MTTTTTTRDSEDDENERVVDPDLEREMFALQLSGDGTVLGEIEEVRPTMGDDDRIAVTISVEEANIIDETFKTVMDKPTDPDANTQFTRLLDYCGCDLGSMNHLAGEDVPVTFDGDDYDWALDLPDNTTRRERVAETCSPVVSFVSAILCIIAYGLWYYWAIVHNADMNDTSDAEPADYAIAFVTWVVLAVIGGLIGLIFAIPLHSLLT